MKKFTIYKHSKLRANNLWEVHRRYDTMKQATQALTDLIKTPKKNRVYVYTILPSLGDSMAVKINDEYVEQLLKTAR